MLQIALGFLIDVKFVIDTFNAYAFVESIRRSTIKSPGTLDEMLVNLLKAFSVLQ